MLGSVLFYRGQPAGRAIVCGFDRLIVVKRACGILREFPGIPAVPVAKPRKA